MFVSVRFYWRILGLSWPRADGVRLVKSLRCTFCGRISIGCAEHWFCLCGLCEPCRERIEGPLR